MDKVDISVCVRPYYHDVVDKIKRKPVFNSKTQKHYVKYKNKKFDLDKRSEGYYIWVDDNGEE